LDKLDSFDAKNGTLYNNKTQQLAYQSEHASEIKQ
jgi:hypothetical protein